MPTTRTNSAYWDDKNGRWKIQVQRDGKRRSFYSSTPGRNGQREANRKADAWLEAALVNPNIRVDRLLDQWLEEVKATTSYTNWRQYESYARNKMKPYIGGIKISRLTEADLQRVITAAYQEGLAHKTLANIRACMGVFLRYCRKARYTTLRPEELTIPAGAPKKEKKVLQPDALMTLFSSDMSTYRGRVQPDWFINVYRFAVTTGLRPGELVGLEWKNIHEGKVTIKGGISYWNEHTAGKNDNAKRTFALSRFGAGVLEAQRAMLKAGGVISPYVFPRRDGEFVRQLALERAWDRYCAYNALEKTTPYELRHTFVSVNKDMPEALLKSIVGHSEDMDTQGTYGHEMQGDMQRAAGMVDEALGRLLKH